MAKTDRFRWTRLLTCTLDYCPQTVLNLLWPRPLWTPQLHLGSFNREKIKFKIIESQVYSQLPPAYYSEFVCVALGLGRATLSELPFSRGRCDARSVATDDLGLAHFNLGASFGVNRRQKVFEDVVLPVVEHPVALNLLVSKINVLNVESRIVLVVSERYFREPFCE